jgi:hypothetical protein
MIDFKMGLWFHCSACNTEAKGRSDRPFTIGSWNEHIKSGSTHSKRLAEMNSVAKIREMQKWEGMYTNYILQWNEISIHMY